MRYTVEHASSSLSYIDYISLAIVPSLAEFMLMVGNDNTPIHSRLWCVYEAHKSQQLNVPTKIAGDPLWLVAEQDRKYQGPKKG